MFPQRVVLFGVLFGSCLAAWNVTCDFDLENIVEIVQYLPTECQDIYKAGPTSDLVESSLLESKKFGEFLDLLPDGSVHLQFDVYKAAALNECANVSDSQPTNIMTKQYYNCLLDKRQQMIDAIKT